jgi:hypothetical protein
VSEVRVEPFATWLEALRWVHARAYAAVAAWCAYLILLAEILLSAPSEEERARWILAARTLLHDLFSELDGAANLFKRLERLRALYRAESAYAQRLESEVRAAARFPRSAVDFEESAAKARFRARSAFLFAEALERFLEVEEAARWWLGEPHWSWDEKEFEARLKVRFSRWRALAGRVLAAQARGERLGCGSILDFLRLFAEDFAPSAKLEPEEAARVVREALLQLDPPPPALEQTAEALEGLRELRVVTNFERMLRELYTELARLNAKRVELGLKPKPLPPLPEEACGWCPECPFRSRCPEAKLIYGEREEEEERRSCGAEEW